MHKKIEDNIIYKKLVLEKKNLPHFFIFFGDLNENKKIVKTFLKSELNIKINKNLDFIEYDFDIFKINDTKKVLKLQLNKNSNKNKQFFLLTVKDINIYSQNALLKTFEEPSENTYFFLLLENDFKILPTLLSRARVLKNKRKKFSEIFLLFLSSDFLKREKIIKEIENTRDKISLIFEFERFFLEEYKKINLDEYGFNMSRKEVYEFEMKLLKLKKISQIEGVAVVNILNYLAIKFPIVNIC